MSILKYFLYLILAFILTFGLTFFIYFEDIKNDAVEKFQKQNYNSSMYLKELLKNTTFNNDFTQIDSSINTFLSIDIFQNMELNYERYVFSKKAILLNSNKINNIRYKLSDVTTDYKYGRIIKLDENTYELIPNQFFDTKQPVSIKFQAYKSGDVYNSTSVLNFYKKTVEKEVVKFTDSWLSSFIEFDSINVNKSFKIEYEKQPYVSVKYTINKSPLIEQTILFIKKIFIYSFSLFIFSIVILYFFYILVIKRDIEKPIAKIGECITDILKNKYVRLNKTNTKIMHIDAIFSKLELMSKKFASVTNELNINRELLKRKDFIDDITGLSNKEVFSKDINSMFLNNSSGYIVLGKIDNLGEFATKNGSNDANHLIKDFGHGIVQLLKKYSKVHTHVYRFYGAEFAIIIELNDLDILKKLMNTVTHDLQNKLKEKYLINGDICYFGATPFDHYGTIDTILHSAHETYITCAERKQELFFISDNAELMEKTQLMEVSVQDIIKRKDFTVKFIYNTYEIDDENTLLMQDASPIILDSQNFELFPIGVFIAMAEKLHLSSIFDKILIEKVLEYFEHEKLEHKVAISLSMNSFTDKKFLSWLEGVLLYNDHAKNSLIFSVTAHNAKDNLDKFNSLVDIIHKFESQIMLKMFTLDEFTLDDVSDLDIDYLRLNKDYCMNINSDRLKKHTVKNIILYGDMNNIKVLGDGVKSEEDYKILSRLGLYATSR
jgi:EAL domain-containing protein (putative c-di-GMP-specific phosphodiesterase class I)/GGDEF domain-containing protein